MIEALVCYGKIKVKIEYNIRLLLEIRNICFLSKFSLSLCCCSFGYRNVFSRISKNTINIDRSASQNNYLNFVNILLSNVVGRFGNYRKNHVRKINSFSNFFFFSEIKHFFCYAILSSVSILKWKTHQHKSTYRFHRFLCHP